MEILKCTVCNDYTLEKICKSCKKPAITPKPAKYSPIDKYGKYRRLAKKNDMDN
ncbi:MAG: nucleolar RNA-binding Nop10p family protein [Nanoarchaeota archaeon]|nr:nucleolar RNA-binding Nop10p family protein [Nanoarchaeota archaeon]